MEVYDICIVGAGAAGLFSASYLVRKGYSVLLLEGGDSFGKKLKMTGNGRCNLSNYEMDENKYHCQDRDFIGNILDKVPVRRLLDELYELNLTTKDINGYIYPADFSASSVIKALSLPFESSDISIKFRCKVREIINKNDIFFLYSDREEGNPDRPLAGKARYVILSCGGLSFPKTGSDGSGIKLCQKMNLKTNKCLPALVPFVTKENVKSLKGLRHIDRISLYIDNEYSCEDVGEIQYTEDGLSGIPVFQISSLGIRAFDEGKKVNLVLNHLPDMTDDEIHSEILRRIKDNKYKLSVLESMNSLLPEKLTEYLLKKIDISPDKKTDEISDNKINEFIDVIKKDSFLAAGFKGFDKAQTTSGGVDVSEINRDTMETIGHKGIFLTGEMLDCDGICGGYNLHFAFSTALLACEGIINYNA